jgi:hypothetical protein
LSCSSSTLASESPPVSFSSASHFSANRYTLALSSACVQPHESASDARKGGGFFYTKKKTFFAKRKRTFSAVRILLTL